MQMTAVACAALLAQAMPLRAQIATGSSGGASGSSGSAPGGVTAPAVGGTGQASSAPSVGTISSPSSGGTSSASPGVPSTNGNSNGAGSTANGNGNASTNGNSAANGGVAGTGANAGNPLAGNGPVTLTLTEIVNIVLGNNTAVIEARQRLQLAVEQINQLNAQNQPQVRADAADTYNSYAATTTTLGPTVQNPVLPSGGTIPTITDEAAASISSLSSATSVSGTVAPGVSNSGSFGPAGPGAAVSGGSTSSTGTGASSTTSGGVGAGSSTTSSTPGTSTSSGGNSSSTPSAPTSSGTSSSGAAGSAGTGAGNANGNGAPASNGAAGGQSGTTNGTAGEGASGAGNTGTSGTGATSGGAASGTSAGGANTSGNAGNAAGTSGGASSSNGAAGSAGTAGQAGEGTAPGATPSAAGAGTGTGTNGTGTAAPGTSNGTGTGTSATDSGTTSTSSSLVAPQEQLAAMPAILQAYLSADGGGSDEAEEIATASQTRPEPASLASPAGGSPHSADVRTQADGANATGGTGTGTGTGSSLAAISAEGARNTYAARATASQYIDLFGYFPASRDVQNAIRDFYLLDLERIENETALVAKNTFFNVLYAQAEEAVEQEQVNYASENVRIVTDQRQQGVAADYDVLTAETALANAQQLLITAQNQLQLAQSQLSYLVGTSPDRTVTLVAPPLPPLTESFSLPQSVQVAGQRRPELRQAQKNVEIANRLIKLAGATLAPTLGIVGVAQYNSVVTTFTPRSLATVSAQLGIPISDGGATRSRVRSARIDLQTQQVNLGSLQLSVSLEVRQAILDVNNAQTRVSTSQVAVTQAEEARRLSVVRYQNGLGTLLDITNAVAQLATAQSNLADANFAYQTALATLVRNEGGR